MIEERKEEQKKNGRKKRRKERQIKKHRASFFSFFCPKKQTGKHLQLEHDDAYAPQVTERRVRDTVGENFGGCMNRVWAKLDEVEL